MSFVRLIYAGATPTPPTPACELLIGRAPPGSRQKEYITQGWLAGALIMHTRYQDVRQAASLMSNAIDIDYNEPGTATAGRARICTLENFLNTVICERESGNYAMLYSAAR